MKVIDLLNKIANGEEVPHFKVSEIEYYLNWKGCLLEREEEKPSCDAQWFIDKEWLNTEVEIIEEEPKVQVELTEKEYLEYLDKINEYMESVRNYTPKPSFLKLEEEKKIPKKICTNRIINTNDILEFEMIQNKINAEYTYAINSIIDYLKSKGE